MTPEQIKLFNEMLLNLKDLTDKFNKLSDLFYRMNLADKFYFEKPLVLQKGFLQSRVRIMQNKGFDIVAANDLLLGTEGNVFTITGNTTINAIAVSNWSKGSEVTLIFTGTPTVKHNTAGSAGTAKIFLLGSIDCITVTNNTTLTLVYDGTVWQEKARKIA